MRILCLLSVLLTACGVQGPAPSDTAATGGAGAAAPSYPEGPYGTEVGAVIENLSFIDRDGETVALESYFGGEEPGLVLFATAGWCSACVEETFILRDGLAEQQPGKAQSLGVLIEDAAMELAEPADVVAFGNLTDAFEFVADADQTIVPYFVNPALPNLILIDTRTMTIELKNTGGEQQIIDAVGTL